MVKVAPVAKNPDGTINMSQSMFALQARGKYGRSGGFGFVRMGYSHYGTIDHVGGIYQKRVTGYNNRGRNPARVRSAYYVKMRPYRPTNPQTPAQQAHRAKMTAAVAAWSLLTAVEKTHYNELGKRRNKVGRNLYISWHIKNH